MKRLTSLFLVLAMLLSFAPMNTFAADAGKTAFSDMKATDYYAQAATALGQLDILAGYPDGTYGADKAITRAEMAAVVCRMIDKEADAKEAQGKTEFDDVVSNHWASGYINIASKEGIINGDGNGKFRPEDNVKYEEAIKMVVCALGYSDEVKADAADWAKGYLDTADDKGILDALKGTKGEAATRGDVAVMSYNGLATESENSKIPATPVASKTAGEYKGTQKVKLTTTTKDADIYYTTDGTTPTAKSTKYTKEISVSKTSTLKAIAIKNGVVSKNVMTVDYTIKQVSSGGGGGGGGSSRPSTPTYTVSFDLNYEGSTGAPTSQNIRSGNKATEPTAPEREGYDFGGWTLDKETNDVFDFTTSITQNTTLYAIWNSGYVVTFDLNYEGAIDTPERQCINVGGKATLPTEPSREGYTFTGWATSSTGETMWNFAHFVTESMTLYAIWATVVDVSLDTPDPSVEIYSFNTDIYDILVGTSDEVTFTSEIFTNIELSDTDVSVVDETGTILGYMNDEGTNGDETADDGIWTLEVNLSSEEVKEVKYSAKVEDVCSEKTTVYFYDTISDEQFDEFDEITYNANAIDNIDDAYAFLLEKESIEEIEIDREKGVIICVFDSGMKYIWEKEVLIGMKGGYIDKSVSLFSYDYDSILDNVESGAYSTTLKRKICIPRPFRNSQFTYDDFKDIGNVLGKGLSSSVTVYDEENANLDVFKSFDDFGIILIDSHGTIDESGEPYILTGESVTSAHRRSEDWSRGRIISAGGRVSVGAEFFERYYTSRSLEDTMFFLGTCYNLHTDSLANTLINKGARVVYGYVYPVGVGYCNDTLCETMVNQLMINQTNAKEAYDNTISTCGTTDAEYEFRGDDAFMLVGHLGSISGKVMSADNSTNINNALVRIYQHNNLIKSVRTDAQGNYTAELPAGDYIVKITAGNYKSAKMAVTVAEDTVTYNETFLLVQIGDEIGYANGTITNALNAQAVSDVTVKVRSSWNNQTGSVIYTTTTNDVGYYEIEYTPGLYTIEFSKDGFITGYKNIVVGVLGLFAQNAIISPVMSDVTGEYRFVLSWRERPDDLDSHLTGPLENSEERFHLYFPYNDRRGEYNPYREYATLDWDNTRINENLGPETVTLYKQIDGVYRYSVHDYTNGGYASSTAMANSNAKVDVYKGSMLIGTYHVPNIAGTIWTVFELSGDVFTPVNRVGNGYADSITLFSLYEEDSSTENQLLYDENIIVSDLIEKE